MRHIKLSDEVWREIARRGKFGETEEDVLRRIFKMQQNASDKTDIFHSATSSKNGFAKERMHAKVDRDGNKPHLKILFYATGEELILDLPADRSDKRPIRDAYNKALQFGTTHGASKGQLMAIRKALTEAGYHLTK